jgi:hypothetical protein
MALMFAIAATLIAAHSSTAVACEFEVYHCWARAQWSMTGAEKVKGAYAEIETFYTTVPNYSDGFVDNSLWTYIPTYASDKWVEAGSMVGFYTKYPSERATKPEYYVYVNYGPGSYKQYNNYATGPADYSWFGVYIDQPYGAGEWCVTWKWDTKPDYCFGPFEHTYSTELWDGLEVADTISSGVENNGQAVGWGEWMNGEWHEEWNGGTAHAEPFWNSPLCINAPSPGYTWGSAAFAVPGC